MLLTYLYILTPGALRHQRLSEHFVDHDVGHFAQGALKLVKINFIGGIRSMQKVGLGDALNMNVVLS